MAGHDWEALYTRLQTATGGWSRDELVELLRDIIREYVIERGLPTGTPAQVASVDLTTLDFAALINHLKRALALPELDLFHVEGRRVLVDADGLRELVARVSDVPRPAAPSAAPNAAPNAAVAPPTSVVPAVTRAEEPKAPADARPVSRRFRKLEFD